MVMGREKLSPEERLREKAAAFKLLAEGLPYGREREDLLLRARRLETASHIGKWISSPGLSPPTLVAVTIAAWPFPRLFLPTREPCTICAT